MPHLFTSDTHPNQSNQEGTGNHSIYGKSGDCLQAFYLRKQANMVCPILGFASLALRPKIRFQSRYYLPKIQESWSRPLSGIQIPTINVPSFHCFRFLWSPWIFAEPTTHQQSHTSKWFQSGAKISAWCQTNLESVLLALGCFMLALPKLSIFPC